MLAIAYRRAARRIRVLPAASHVVRGRLESAFGLPDERVPVTGEPRVDVLSRGTAAARRAQARERIDAAAGPLDAASRLVLYAPTWRDGEPDPAVPSDGEWRGLLDVLERHDAVLLVRSHPLGAGEYRPPVATERVRTLGSDLVADVTPLLPGLDALVTDYSSLIFDSSLVPLPVVFLAPDVEAYARRRGFYGTYADVAGAEAAADWASAAERLDALLGDGAVRDAALDRARRLDAQVHAYRDGESTTGCTVRFWPASGPNGAPPQTPGSLSHALRKETDDRRALLERHGRCADPDRRRTPARLDRTGGSAGAGGGRDQRRWREVAGRPAAARRALGRSRAAAAHRRLHASGGACRR